jgi:metal-responsive CopG/Arc/MetJ family transcriptional regulator
VQVNVRLDDGIVEQLDGWTVIRGVGRPELIREAVSEWLRRREDERVGEAYRRAYEEMPETDDELEQAAANARHAIAEEPWAKWW